MREAPAGNRAGPFSFLAHAESAYNGVRLIRWGLHLDGFCPPYAVDWVPPVGGVCVWGLRQFADALAGTNVA